METHRLHSFFVVAACAIVAAFSSCSKTKDHTAPAVNERDSVAMMVSYGVNTLISDSGVIKYRIVTERWAVNTAKQPSRWEFMKGVLFEQFDEQFHIEAYIQADTAWYFDQQKLWHLRGRVSIRNINGMIYNSEELFWDGIRHEFYSHVYSRVITPDRTLEGTNFRSDEHMDHYTVSNSKGNFINPEEEKDEEPSSATTASEKQQKGKAGSEADSTDSIFAEPIRPAAAKHQKNQ